MEGSILSVISENCQIMGDNRVYCVSFFRWLINNFECISIKSDYHFRTLFVGAKVVGIVRIQFNSYLVFSFALRFLSNCIQRDYLKEMSSTG